MMALMLACGVTSKAGWRAWAPAGVDAGAAKVGDLGGVALFDGYVGAAGDGQVDGRQRRGHVERHAVLFGQHRQRVRADLVGGVAVGGDAVGPDHYAVDLSPRDEVPRHVVGDDAVLDALDAEFPRRKARALQPRPGLVDEHRDGAAVALVAGADDAQRRAVAGGRQGARVAVREDGGAGREQRRAEGADGVAAADVVVVDLARPGQQGEPAFVGRRVAALPQGAHLGDGPGEVDGGGPRLGEARRRLVQGGVEGGAVAAGEGGLAGGQRQGAGRGHADGGRPAHGHVADACGDVAPGGAGDVALVGGQRELVDEHDRVGADLDRLDAQLVLRVIGVQRACPCAGRRAARDAGDVAARRGLAAPAAPLDPDELRCPGPRRPGTWPARR